MYISPGYVRFVGVTIDTFAGRNWLSAVENLKALPLILLGSLLFHPFAKPSGPRQHLTAFSH
jgi:hypothetical protein